MQLETSIKSSLQTKTHTYFVYLICTFCFIFKPNIRNEFNAIKCNLKPQFSNPIPCSRQVIDKMQSRSRMYVRSCADIPLGCILVAGKNSMCTRIRHFLGFCGIIRELRYIFHGRAPPSFYTSGTALNHWFWYIRYCYGIKYGFYFYE